MQKIRNFVKIYAKRAYLWALFGLLMVFNILMNAPDLPSSAAVLQKLSGTVVFDLMATGYDVPTVKQVLDSYGDKGLVVYHNFMLLDIFFPATYGLLFSGFIFLVLGNKSSFLRYLFLAPLVTAVLDYIENIGIFLMVNSYPNLSATWVVFASFSTQLKMIGNLCFVLSLLTAIVFWLVRQVKK